MYTKEDIEKAKQYLDNEGYGTGSNFTLNAVANLMAEYAAKNCFIPDVIKSLPSAIILAEKFAESKREHVVKCRIGKGSIANLGLYLGFIEGYNYVIEELKQRVSTMYGLLTTKYK